MPSYHDEFDISSSNIEELAKAYKYALGKKITTQNTNDNKDTQIKLFESIISNLQNQMHIYNYLSKTLHNKAAKNVISILYDDSNKHLNNVQIVYSEITGNIINKNKSNFEYSKNYCDALKRVHILQANLLGMLFDLYNIIENKIVKIQLFDIFNKRVEDIRLLVLLYGECQYRGYAIE